MHILNQIPSRCKLRRIFKRALWKDGRPVCPRCGSRSVRNIVSEERWRCRKCRKPFSLKSVSWMKDAKLSLETIWLLLWCWQHSIPLKQTSLIVGVSYPTVFSWYGRFREHVPKERLECLLEDKVATDELYTKGHCVLGAKEKGTRKISIRVLPVQYAQRQHVIEFLVRNVKAETELSTDGSALYKGIGNWHRLRHTYEIHKKFEFSKTAEIEGLWGVFRTFIRRMYHHVTEYKLEEIANEFVLRFRKDEIFENPQRYLEICLNPEPFAL